MANSLGQQVSQSSVSYTDTSMYAIVIEDAPRDIDSILRFESFPVEGIKESYRVKPYDEKDGAYQSQVSYAGYTGGNWGPFPISLEFRAGNQQGQGLEPFEMNDDRLQQMLLEMEAKVNWCVALAFPLSRRFEPSTQAIINNALGVSRTQANSNTKSLLARADPPRVRIILGAWRSIRAYMTRVEWQWTGPWHPVTGRPYGCKVNMVFQPIPKRQATWRTIRNQAGKFGLSSVLESSSAIQSAVQQSTGDANRARLAANAAAQSELRELTRREALSFRETR